MTDDERLLALLNDVLSPEPVQPPPGRVTALRRVVERVEGAGDGQPARPPVSARPVSGRPVSGRPVTAGPRGDRGRSWGRRAGWVAAGASVAAAALAIALIAVPSLVSSGRSGSGDTASPQARMPQAVQLLRVALVSKDVVAVARADANLLREAKSIAPPQRDDAVAAHVEAIQFLRDHPSADAAAELAAPPPAAPTSEASPSPTTVVPAPDPGLTGDTPPPTVAPSPPEPTTVADVPPDVTIDAVVASLDGTFQVDFTVAGFTPDASGAPGTHSVRFSFDDGQAPTTWDGPSPWSFPVSAGLTYRQVCAHVVDAAGVEDPSTGGCHDIV